MDPSTHSLSWTNRLLNKFEDDYKSTYSTPAGETKKISNEIKGALQRVAIRAPGTVVVIGAAIADAIYELAVGIIKTAGVLLAAIPNAICSLFNWKPLISNENCTRTIIIQHFVQAGKHLAAIVPLVIIIPLFGPEEAVKAFFSLENEVTTLTKSIAELDKKILALTKEKKGISSKLEESKLEAKNLALNEVTPTPTEEFIPFSTLQIELTRRTQRQKDLEDQLKSSEAKLKDLEAKLKSAEEEAENLRKQLTAATATPLPKAAGELPPPPIKLQSPTFNSKNEIKSKLAASQSSQKPDSSSNNSSEVPMNREALQARLKEMREKSQKKKLEAPQTPSPLEQVVDRSDLTGIFRKAMASMQALNGGHENEDPDSSWSSDDEDTNAPEATEALKTKALEEKEALMNSVIAVVEESSKEQQEELIDLINFQSETENEEETKLAQQLFSKSIILIINERTDIPSEIKDQVVTGINQLLQNKELHQSLVQERKEVFWSKSMLAAQNNQNPSIEETPPWEEEPAPQTNVTHPNPTQAEPKAEKKSSLWDFWKEKDTASK